MNDDLACPVCDAHAWRTLGKKNYRKSETQHFGEYVQARFRVLFEVWFPGSEEIQLTSCMCEDCGFVLYLPRPENADLHAKYTFLGNLTSATKQATETDPSQDQVRANDMYRHIRSMWPIGVGMRVLDFGGGDGRLMAPFVAAGAQCFLVDYARRAVPGVERLGSTLDDLDPGVKFDLIVCSVTAQTRTSLTPAETTPSFSEPPVPGQIATGRWRTAPSSVAA